MMNLRTLSMLPDDIGPLGPPIRREQTKPAPAPTVQQREDGTLTTNPDGTMSFEPKVAETQPVPVFPHAPKEDPEPGAHGFMREPLKVGDRIRRLVRSHSGAYPKGFVHVVQEITTTAAVLPPREGDVLLSNEGKTWERVQ